MESKHYIVHKENMKWDEGMYKGTSMSYLWEEPETGRVVFLVKVEPGGRIPLHNHYRREIAYVVEGEVKLNDDIMRAGDLLVAAGEQDHDVYTETGCTFFIYIDYNPKKNKIVKVEPTKG